MWPVIFTFGPLVLKTINVFSVLAILTGLFLFWRKGREEHYDEMVLFDGIFQSLLLGFIVGRLLFIATHFQEFQWNIISWFDIFGQPGYLVWGVIAVSGWFMQCYARRHKWDVLEVLDFWALAVSAVLVIQWLGSFLGGSALGVETTVPWGVQFPSVFVKQHPVQLYFSGAFLVLTSYLYWAEYNYRTFQWYRSSKNTAQTGYLLSVFLMGTGLIIASLSPFMITTWVWNSIRADVIIGILTLFSGLILLLIRSGKLQVDMMPWRKQKRLTDFKA